MLRQKILDAYADGSALGLIIESFNITHKQLVSELLSYKEESRYKKTFTDEFKTIIAQRDINGVSRSDIAKELQINANTVKKACEQFGNSLKGRAKSDNEFTRIDGVFPLDKCPSCGSKKVNLVDEKTTYCKECGSEHIHEKDHVLKLAWEYLKEE